LLFQLLHTCSVQIQMMTELTELLRKMTPSQHGLSSQDRQMNDAMLSVSLRASSKEG